MFEPGKIRMIDTEIRTPESRKDENVPVQKKKGLKLYKFNRYTGKLFEVDLGKGDLKSAKPKDFALDPLDPLNQNVDLIIFKENFDRECTYFQSLNWKNAQRKADRYIKKHGLKSRE